MTSEPEKTERKKPGPPKGTGGRPRKELDWAKVDKLCTFWATEVEIAAWFGCSIDVINRRCKELYGKTFAEYSQEKRLAANAPLRKRQRALALEGNPTMLIWLGKQRLGQRDKQSVEHSGPEGGPIEVKAADLSDDELAGLIKQKRESECDGTS